MNHKTLLSCALFVMLGMAITQAQPTTSLSDGIAMVPRTKKDLTVPPSYQTSPVGSPGFSSPTFDNLQGYIADHLQYPEAALENGIEGQVLVEVTIGKTGTVENASVTRGLALGCNEAALAMVRQMPAWTPATLDGTPVKGQATIALNFRIR